MLEIIILFLILVTALPLYIFNFYNLLSFYFTLIYQLFHFSGNDTDPDRHALVADPDPAKWCGSGSTTLHTAHRTIQFETDYQSMFDI